MQMKDPTERLMHWGSFALQSQQRLLDGCCLAIFRSWSVGLSIVLRRLLAYRLELPPAAREDPNGFSMLESIYLLFWIRHKGIRCGITLLETATEA